MVHITFPDGNIKDFEDDPTGVDIAQSISDNFARNCLAMVLAASNASVVSPVAAMPMLEGNRFKPPRRKSIERSPS